MQLNFLPLSRLNLILIRLKAVLSFISLARVSNSTCRSEPSVGLMKYLKRKFRAGVEIIKRPDLALAIFAGTLAWIATSFLRSVFQMVDGLR
jgi:hypothetical protein